MMPGNYSEYSPPPPYNENCSVPIVQSPAPVYRPSPNRKLFCGCGPKTWTKIIGGIQITFCLIGLLLRLVASVSGPSQQLDRERNVDVFGRPNIYDDEDDLTYFRYSRYNADPRVQAFEAFIGLAFGCILYAGAHYGKPLFLLIWLIMAGIALGFIGIALIILVLFLFLGGGMIVVVIIIFVLIPGGIYLFCFHVVSLHRRELIDQQNLIQHPTVQFHSVYVDADKQNF